MALNFVGCEKKSGEAFVIGRDYVAAVKEGERVEDERATNHEQWIVKVEMTYDRRKLDVRANRRLWEKLKDGDRVKVRYRAGKYTGTVCGSEIE